MDIHHTDVPGFHGQGLALGPKPNKVNSENQKQKCLKGMAVVHGVAGLTQRAEQVAGNKDHAKQQHAFIKPACHTPLQGGGGHFRGVHTQVDSIKDKPPGESVAPPEWQPDAKCIGVGPMLLGGQTGSQDAVVGGVALR